MRLWQLNPFDFMDMKDEDGYIICGEINENSALIKLSKSS